MHCTLFPLDQVFFISLGFPDKIFNETVLIMSNPTRLRRSLYIFCLEFVPLGFFLENYNTSDGNPRGSVVKLCGFSTACMSGNPPMVARGGELFNCFILKLK